MDENGTRSHLLVSEIKKSILNKTQEEGLKKIILQML